MPRYRASLFLAEVSFTGNHYIFVKLKRKMLFGSNLLMFFYSFFAKLFILLPMRNFLKKGVIKMHQNAIKMPVLLPIESFAKKGVILRGKITPF